MKILAIELSNDEENKIFDTLIEKFDPQLCAHKLKGQEVNFPVNEQIEIYATLNLNVEYSEFDSNHQTSPIYVYSSFIIDFYHDGNEVKGMENSNIYNKIENHNWKQYF
jgi:hypothetical protein